jgi:hypothetical protein
MESRRNTGGDCGRLPEITRRTLVGAVAAPALAHERAGRAGEVLTHSRTWLALDAEFERAMLAWQEEESRLGGAFLPKPDAEQRRRPEAALLNALSDQMDALDERRWELMEALETLPAADLHDVAGKLAVAVRAMRHEEIIGYELLAMAVKELADQRCRTCGARLMPSDLLA